MISIRRLVAAAGFILFGITFSSLFTLFPKVQHLENEIFWTNCPILLQRSDQKANETTWKSYLPSCESISGLIPSGLVACGLLLLIFGFTKQTCLICVLNLLIVAIFYCNPIIDSSFKSFSHFLELLICAIAFLICFVKQGEKQHSE